MEKIKKFKILLASDDLRMHSGISTMSRELVLGTAHVFDWVQMAGMIQHPDKGKAFDMSEATNKLLNRKDCYVKLYPTDGYGNEEILFTLMNMEKPDAILHFTDPRFWQWLYMIEKQIRRIVPLTYLNIWDSVPYPMYNRPYYESCDVLMSISKQTYNINKWVLGPENCCTLNGLFDKDGKLVPYSGSLEETKQNIIKNMIETYNGRVTKIGIKLTPELITEILENKYFNRMKKLFSQLKKVIDSDLYCQKASEIIDEVNNIFDITEKTDPILLKQKLIEDWNQKYPDTSWEEREKMETNEQEYVNNFIVPTFPFIEGNTF